MGLFLFLTGHTVPARHESVLDTQRATPFRESCQAATLDQRVGRIYPGQFLVLAAGPGHFWGDVEAREAGCSAIPLPTQRKCF